MSTQPARKPQPLGPRWRKSSYSGYAGNCVEVAFRKSTYSTCHGACAEVGLLASDTAPGYVVGVRDSKDPDGPVLTFAPADWQEFVTGVKAAPPIS